MKKGGCIFQLFYWILIVLRIKRLETDVNQSAISDAAINLAADDIGIKPC